MAGWIHGTAPPVFHESPDHVSLPHSPGPGADLMIQTISRAPESPVIAHAPAD